MKLSWVNAAAGGTTTKANHPMVCGQPWPVDGEYAEGSWWTPDRHGRFAMWHADVRAALGRFVYSAKRHRQILLDRFQATESCRAVRLRGAFSMPAALAMPPTVISAQDEEKIEAKVAHCESCRLHLVRMSGSEDGDTILRWVTGSVRTMRRLAAAGFVPLPPSDTIP